MCAATAMSLGDPATWAPAAAATSDQQPIPGRTMSYFPDHLADRYRRFKLRHFIPHQDDYEQLASQGQNPEVMVVSCCDSRVEPEAVFSAMPGELFAVRNVANLVPPYETDGKYHGVSAALEFAVLNIRVKHIVVMGHSGCGGVKACIEHDATRQTAAEFIANWMSMLDVARDRIIGEKPGQSPADLRAALERGGHQGLARQSAHVSLRADPRGQGPPGAARRLLRHLEWAALGAQRGDGRLRAAVSRRAEPTFAPIRLFFSHGSTAAPERTTHDHIA